MIRQILLILFISVLKVANAQNKNDTTLKTKEVIILREVCDYSTYSFCSDGYGQPYRMFPCYLFIDSLNIGSNYISDISKLPSLYNSIIQSKDIFESLIIDSLFSDKESTENIIILYSKYFKRKVNRYYRRNNIDKYFDGKLAFYLYKATVTYETGPKIEVFIPNSIYNDKNNLLALNVNLLYFVQIKDIRPYIIN